MSRADLRSVLKSLSSDADAAPRRQDETPLETALGPTLTRGPDGTWQLDVGSIILFAGIECVVEPLLRDLDDACFRGNSDVMVECRVDEQLTPALYRLGVRTVCFYAPFEALETFPTEHAAIGNQIRYIFNALQGERWGGELFPAWPDAKPRSRPATGRLLFPFHRSSLRAYCYYLVEFNDAGHFLRLTLEEADNNRLHLRQLPHQIVGRIDLVETQVDIHRAIQSVTIGIRNASRALQFSHTETETQIPDYFRMLRTAGLERLRAISFEWESAEQGRLLSRNSEWFDAMARCFFTLPDRPIVERLLAGERVAFVSGEHFVFAETAQRHRHLTLSLGRPRRLATLDDCLAAMPMLARLPAARPTVLRGVHIVLIHHLTAETIGLVAAFDRLGVASQHTLFVKYAGSPPPHLLDIILSLPAETFRFYGLQHFGDPQSVAGGYQLSDDYSALDDWGQVAAHFRANRLSFLDAMRFAAGYLFLRQAMQCRLANAPLLLVEDGGYIAPIVNRLVLEGRSLGDALASFACSPAPQLPEPELRQGLGDWLRPFFLGSVEHTRNGFDALMQVQDERGRLAFPAATIAISDYKVNRESQEVAESCLNAVENVLYGMGRTLNQRTALVLGSCGAIGRCASDLLLRRLGRDRFAGVDRTVPAGAPLEKEGGRHWHALEELPPETWRDMDFVFGVIGQSILTPDYIERWVMEARHEHLYVVSGSTKTVEFTHLLDWLQACHAQPSFRIGPFAAHLKLDPIRDPRFLSDQGIVVSIEMQANGAPPIVRRLYLLAHLMPVNFLYYGVPSEVMDCVMTQLAQVAAGLSEQRGQLPARVLAVDHEIQLSAQLESGTPLFHCR
ncbi:MAG: hypothetical protein A3K19_25385 [Lentisphaerae bacterium RIFOXYB12_FULL_65_16]|nr:MAG: hypothetical protein A3K18_22090 [Lentisphaerae bacterium RIFOXYA12_64_32]OGV87648.1 MAG: hypothetical protein A3K19_25385 [Lentisphaerae bacterium RIFOXYB12_FULL_65_16]